MARTPPVHVCSTTVDTRRPYRRPVKNCLAVVVNQTISGTSQYQRLVIRPGMSAAAAANMLDMNAGKRRLVYLNCEW